MCDAHERAVDGGLMRLLFAFGREEAVHVAPVLKHFQGILRLAVRGLQHQQHDAEVGFHVPRIEPVGFLHNLHAPRRRAV